MQLPWASAVKFLMARKFNVDRALVLYQQHEIMRSVASLVTHQGWSLIHSLFRIREGLTFFDHSSGPLQSELSKGKFTILPCRDPNGEARTLAHYAVSHHY